MRHKLVFSLIISLLLSLPVTDLNAQRKNCNIHYVENTKKHNTQKHHKLHKRYSNLPRWGANVKSIHTKSTLLRYNNRNFYFHSGIYYQKVNKQYKVVRAPIGLRVKVLPKAAKKVFVNWRPYYYYYGTFYVKAKDGTYETVDAPEKAQVEILPEGVEEVKVDGEILYNLNGEYYKPTTNDKGEAIYEVVKIE